MSLPVTDEEGRAIMLCCDEEWIVEPRFDWYTMYQEATNGQTNGQWVMKRTPMSKLRNEPNITIINYKSLFQITMSTA